MLDQHHGIHLILEIILVIHLEIHHETPPRIVLFSIELQLM
jgi:hypothetical protein